MALDRFPGTVQVYSRAEMAAKWKRDYQLRIPAADVGPNSLPEIEAGLFSEQAMIVHNDAIVIGRSTNVDDAQGTALDEKHGNPIGVPRLGATGASGFVIVSAAASGTTIFEGDELTYQATNGRYRCTVTALYDDGENVPVEGIDTGTASDLAAGSILQWVSPRSGCNSTCEVYEQSDGSGLTGGAEAENDDDYKVRIKFRLANPPASGNDSAYLEAIEAYPGIGIQKGFTFPCITGPGVSAITFTLRPSAPGASRIPNPAQLAAVKAALRTTFPADDGIYAAQLIAENVTIVLAITWRKRAKGWADAAPWPEYVDPAVAVAASPAPTATTFRLTTTTSTTTPQVGQTIAFYDAANLAFRNKRIGAVSVVSAGLSWDLTADTANNASDTSYTPVAGDIASPWSESLNLLVTPIVEFFDALGPGEMVATFADPGTRQRRQPENPETWPSAISNRLASAIQALPSVNDAELTEPAALPYEPTVGVPGVSAYLLQLANLGVYPQ